MPVAWDDFEAVDSPQVNWSDFEPVESKPETPQFEAPPLPTLTKAQLEEVNAPWYKPPPEMFEPIGGAIPPPSTAEGPIAQSVQGIGDVIRGAANFVRSPAGLLLGGLTAVAPPLGAAAMGAMGAQAIGEGSGKLSVPVGTPREVASDIGGTLLMGLGAAGSAGLLAKTAGLLPRSLAETAKIIAEDRGEALAKIANEYEASRQVESGSPFVRAEPAPETISPGVEQGKLPSLGTGPTFEPSGLKLAEPVTEPTPTIPETIDRTVEAANVVREMADQRERTLDFAKAVAEKVSQEHEPPIHPDKPLTENQLTILYDSLTKAIEKNQIPGTEKGFIVGSALEKWANDVLRGGGTHGGADVVAAYLVRGAAFLEKGITEFAKWSAAMVGEFGEKIRPQLKALYDKSIESRAKSFGQKPETKTTGETNASSIETPAAVHGDMRPLTVQGQGQVPANEGGQGVQSQTSGGIPEVQAQGQQARVLLNSFRQRLVNSWNTRGNKSDIARRKDAADSQSAIFSRNQGNSVKLEAQRLFGPRAGEALKAVVPVIESAGDRNRLTQFIEQSTGKHLEAQRAAEFAQANWDRIQPLAARIKQIHDAQIVDENANGINTEYRENYIRHAFDVNKLPNRGEEFFSGGSGPGKRSGFKAQRKFETIYDAIEAGYGKALRSIDSSKLVEDRVRNGQQMINDRQWVNSFRNVVDPTTNKPLLVDTKIDPNGVHIAPPGYDAISILPGQFLGIHNGYRGIFDAITGTSKLAQAELGGLPLGKALLNTTAGIKHGLLLFDTFHASRVMQKQFFLTGRVGHSKGLSLLEYADRDLAEAVNQGEITQQMEDYARANRPTANLLIKEGLNVGRISEALRSEIVRNLPVIGTFNKWVFDKVTRGAMMQSALLEFERVSKNNPEMPASEVAAKVAKQINITFGNIGRQGLFKSKTFQDISRLIALAPQWVESMARSEIGGFKQLAQVPFDLAAGKGLQVGTLGKAMAGGILAYVVGTQLLNLATRKQFTWDNKEEGHKLDAWIPDVTGKTKGFFLNPLSVVAELTHDAYRYAFKKDSAIDVAKQIAENKASPLMRAVGTLWSGKNFSGEKIMSTWKRIAESGAALLPAPIPVQATVAQRPGQLQRQLTASLGLKTEPAPTSLQQIRKKASDFMDANGKPKEVDIVYHEGSPHSELRNAIINEDKERAIKAIQELRKTQSDPSILRSQHESSRRAFTSTRLEAKFKQSLSPDDRLLYDQAKSERAAMYQKFLELWRQRGPRPTK